MRIPTREDILHIQGESIKLRNFVDGLLKDPDRYPDIISLMSQEQCHQLASLDQDIQYLEIISQIVDLELKNGIDNVLFTGRDVNSVIRTYRILSLFLRRIEFGFPKDLQRDIVSYIIREKISLIALIGIIQSNVTILQKDKVCDDLTSLLDEMV